MFRTISLFVFALLLGLIARGQEQNIYTPAPVIKKNVRFIAETDSLNKLYCKRITGISKKSEYIRNVFKERKEYLNNAVSNGDFMFDCDIYLYVQQIFDTIVKYNPPLQGKMRIVVSRYTEPNAFALGDGTIVVNLGLLNRLDNESQLAFIICHELSHQYFDHVFNKINLIAEKKFDEDFDKQIKKTLKQEYNVHSKLMALVMPLLFDITKYSRTDESQADSMGLIFLSHTPYNTSESIKAIAKLDLFDLEKDTNNIDLKKSFDYEDYLFKNEWLTYHGASSLGAFEYKSTAIDDSLKTHPDCKIRASALEHLYSKLTWAPGKIFLQPEDKFKEISYHAEAEIIETNYRIENYGRALFLALQMSMHFPQDIYSKLIVSRCLSKIYLNRKKHVPYMYVDNTSNEYFENYNRVLAFINELTMHDLEMLGYLGFQKCGNDKFGSNEDYLFTKLVIYLAHNDLVISKSVKENYVAIFKGGKFAEEVTNIKIN
ncbi:MAG: M48 family metallopeptidase [Bacteroidia bacterium]